MATHERARGAAAREAAAGGGNAGDLRRLNLGRVLAVAMEREAPFTRAEIIAATGLSAPTVGSLVTDLLGYGILRDLGTGPSSGGRRPSFMEFNARYGYIAGIDLGPTRTRLAVADLRGEMVAHDIVDTPTRAGPAGLLGQLASALKALLRRAKVSPDRLIAAGAGAPGVVDRHHGIVRLAPNLKGWSNVPMRRILQGALGVPVSCENDVNLAILGEHWKGAARGHDTCAFIFVGTGIGAGFLIDGHLHRGHNSMAGEIAVMSMGPQFLDVDYGTRGCLETLAGLQALAQRWPGADLDSPDWLPALLAAAARGDRLAEKAVAETARLIAMAAINVGTVVDPSLIVLGGAMFAQAEPLVEEVRQVVTRIARAPVEIAVSALGKEAPLAGALLVAAQEARRQVRQQLRELRSA